MTVPTATISSDRLAASISACGAELQTLSATDGRELLWDGNPAYWTGRAPILFPVIGTLAGGCYRLDGKSYPMFKHGFARQSLFEVVERIADAATFRLSASGATRTIYPFEFQLDVRYAVTGARLTCEATIANLGDRSMPASFGFHPALRWPLPNGKPRAEHRLCFEMDEPAPVRRIGHDGLLLARALPTPIIAGTLMLRDELFQDDALIFDRIASRRVTYGAESGSRLAMEFAGFSTLGVWTRPGAGFICIEPWQGLPDPAGFTGEIRDKPGIIEIAPGESRRFSMSLGLID